MISTEPYQNAVCYFGSNSIHAYKSGNIEGPEKKKGGEGKKVGKGKQRSKET
jgi:hypothetical protein